MDWKKTSGMAIIFLLLIGILGVTTAVQAASITLSIPQIEAKTGDIVNIPIKASGAPGVGALQLDLVYDGTILKADSINKGALLGSNVLLQSNTDKAGRVMIALATLEGFKGDGEVVNVRFKIVGQSGQSSVLNIENAFVWEGSSHQDVQVKTEAGQIKIINDSGFWIWIILGVILILVLLLVLLFIMRRSKRKAAVA